MFTIGEAGSGFRVLVAISVPSVVAVLLFLVATHDPEHSSLFPPCVFYEISGWFCPGCGSTRMLHQMLNGNIGSAFGLNPATFMLLPAVSYDLARRWTRLCFRVALPGTTIPSWAIRGFLWTYLAFWFLRNVPYYPFEMLAP